LTCTLELGEHKLCQQQINIHLAISDSGNTLPSAACKQKVDKQFKITRVQTSDHLAG